MAKRPTKHRRRRLPRLLLLAVLAALFLWWSNSSLQTTRFDPVFSRLPEGFDGCRIVVLSDLHGTEFGENNEKLFAAAAAAQPEYIFVFGDLIDEETPDPIAYAAELAAGLQSIAPVY